MRTLLPLLSMLAAIGLQAQPQMPADTRTGLVELHQLAQRQPDPLKLTAQLQGRFPAALMRGRCMVGFLGKVDETFDLQAVDAQAVHVGTRLGNVLSFRVDARRLDALHNIPGLAYAELAGIARPTLDKLVRSIHADSVQQGINLPQPYSGEGVLIGVLDWGFDYTHPMFHDTALAQSRVVAAWDQFRQGGNAPAGFGYGAEFNGTNELFAAGSDTANIYGHALHGTHVAGIAGGGGAGTNYRGVAFGAEYLFCTFLVDAAAAIDGVAWMQQKAQQQGKRLVVNMSWGLYHMGTLDGNSLLGQAYGQFADEGVAIAVSAGNNGDVNFHLKHAFANDTLTSRVQFYPFNANPNMYGQSLIAWGMPGENFSAKVRVLDGNYETYMESPWIQTASQPAYTDTFLAVGIDTVYLKISCDAAHPLNGRPHLRIRAKNRYNLPVLLMATAASGEVHFWNVADLETDVGNWGQAFLAGQPGWTAGDKEYGIGEPASTEKVITVAACASTLWTPTGNPYGGNIAGFSSQGPTLDGRRKPDITAPGVSVASSISSFTDNSYSPLTNVPFQGRNYPFARLSGTSMAAPAVTGTVALILQADPTLTPAEIRDIIRNTALTDQYTGTIPASGDPRWGMGKLNAYRAVTEVLGTTGVQDAETAPLRVWPNPSHDRFYIHTASHTAPEQLTVQDALGRVVETRLAAPGIISVDAATWAPGLYFIRMENAAQTLRAKVVRE